MMRTFALFAGLLLIIGAPVQAQPASCPVLVAQALIAVGDVCGEIGRNQACYGNLQLSATPRDPTAVLNFDAAGDRVSVADISSLQLTALTPENNEWGIAVMALQANLPDNLPGQNATVVLFGDVALENRGTDAAPLPDVFVTAGSANVRQTPSTSGAIVGRLGSTPQRVVGRLADGSWLRVALDDGTDGWVSAAVVTVDGDITLLPAQTADDPAPASGSGYRPMQAFRLKTGIGAPSCSEAPASGIMIQTPEGAGEVTFEINKVTIALGSTAVARTTGDTMRVALVEGRANITVAGKSGVIRAGRVGVFQLDPDGDATGDYTIEDYAESDVANLPLVLLPEPVDLTASAAGPSSLPPSGTWTFHSTLSSQTTCPGVVGLIPDSTDEYVLTVAEDGTIEFDRGTMVIDADGVWHGEYVDDMGHSSNYEFIFEGNSASGHYYTQSDFGSGPCMLVFDLTMEYVGP